MTTRPAPSSSGLRPPGLTHGEGVWWSRPSGDRLVRSAPAPDECPMHGQREANGMV
ncbi:hypothetical protein [Streptomyces sp. NPDC048489]|uniref:hypothetical protein n=1 Tax=Streptomyces sp. NPDC048489 TaxID=3154504 RepID=UPI00342199E0